MKYRKGQIVQLKGFDELVKIYDNKSIDYDHEILREWANAKVKIIDYSDKIFDQIDNFFYIVRHTDKNIDDVYGRIYIYSEEIRPHLLNIDENLFKL
ncbi:MAG: hypothetical protein ACOCP8_06585 [archaeon]